MRFANPATTAITPTLKIIVRYAENMRDAEGKLRLPTKHSLSASVKSWSTPWGVELWPVPVHNKWEWKAMWLIHRALSIVTSSPWLIWSVARSRVGVHNVRVRMYSRINPRPTRRHLTVPAKGGRFDSDSLGALRCKCSIPMLAIPWTIPIMSPALVLRWRRAVRINNLWRV